MRLLIYITFLFAILFSELVPHMGFCGDTLAFDMELPTEESGDKENGEETNEDHVEEDKLFNEYEQMAFGERSKLALLPCKHLILFSQSLREIHIPPPDLV